MKILRGNEYVVVKVGMCCVAYDPKSIKSSVPYADFIYIIEQIKDNGVLLRDNGHHNVWHISEKELFDDFVLVSDIHSCGSGFNEEAIRIADYVNDALENNPPTE